MKPATVLIPRKLPVSRMEAPAPRRSCWCQFRVPGCGRFSGNRASCSSGWCRSWLPMPEVVEGEAAAMALELAHEQLGLGVAFDGIGFADFPKMSLLPGRSPRASSASKNFRNSGLVTDWPDRLIDRPPIEATVSACSRIQCRTVFTTQRSISVMRCRRAATSDQVAGGDGAFVMRGGVQQHFRNTAGCARRRWRPPPAGS